jgi:NAD(P)-dependent dehydrogenase (short-subunit alcohol dehydrogenase family)
VPPRRKARPPGAFVGAPVDDPARLAYAPSSVNPADANPAFPAPRALVTGAGRGIGCAIATHLAAAGARLVLHAREHADRARALAASLPGGPHATALGDLTAPAELGRAFDEAWGAFGGLDVLVNNAAIYEEHPPLELDPEAWRRAWARTLAINLDAPAALCHLAARRMAEAGGGRLVNVSSRGAFRGEPTAPAYAASKAGLNALTQSFAKAFAARGVLAFVVAPGWVDTERVAPIVRGERGEAIRQDAPLGRVATADEVAAVVRFLALEAPASMTGAIVDVNGASYLRTLPRRPAALRTRAARA